MNRPCSSFRALVRPKRCSYPVEVTDKAACVWSIACGAKSEAVCAYCAWRYRNDTKRLIGSGCIVSERDGITAGALGGFRFFFVTLTAPSFGTVHHAEACPCGKSAEETHARLIGIPRGEAYDYAGAVGWNQASTELFRRSWDLLRKRLEARGVDGSQVAYASAREWQRRGSIHFHLIARVRPRRTPSTGEGPLGATTGDELCFVADESGGRLGHGRRAGGRPWGSRTGRRSSAICRSSCLTRSRLRWRRSLASAASLAQARAMLRSGWGVRRAMLLRGQGRPAPGGQGPHPLRLHRLPPSAVAVMVAGRTDTVGDPGGTQAGGGRRQKTRKRAWDTLRERQLTLRAGRCLGALPRRTAHASGKSSKRVAPTRTISRSDEGQPHTTRRRRDLNPRWAINPNLISSEAP